MYQLVDFATKRLVKPNNLVFTGKNDPWEIVMDLALIKTKINLNHFKSIVPGFVKYLPLMPIRNVSEFVSLTEVATPLIRSKNLSRRLGLDLYFKVESKNPTGSFKDRGSTVEVSVAKELGAKAIILASTGNMAASCACYSAAAKMPCFVLVPKGVSMAKLAQTIAFGGEVIQVEGHYNDAATLAKNIAIKNGFYLAGDYAYRVEGQKTAAFEVIDQLFFQAPDVVVVPMGCGTNISAYAKGFTEYYQLGLIDRVPQLMGVQAQGASAIVNSYLQQRRAIEPLEAVNTVASAIAVSDPLDGMKALDAIYASHGCAVSVTDEEILQAKYLLSSEEGLYVESASAATLAALMQPENKDKYADRKVVCVLTGDGLKDVNTFFNVENKLTTINPEIREFELLWENKGSTHYRKITS